MKLSNTLRSAVALVCAYVLIMPQIDARTKQGDKFLKLGAKAESEHKYDQALAYYDQAVDTDHDEPSYIMADQRMRVKVADIRIAEGRRLQHEQKLDEALLAFQRAFLADPSSEIALQEVRQTTAMLRERAAAPAGTPILTPAEKARQEMEQRINSLEGP
ncbi:MAG: hypothetical protein JO211_07900, partial [Acidobacteriaceae bacterium]|nr:hypothetical protein [Acidobacteriaceae bacterium]